MTLVFAFTAGLLATVNPCGWAMLPSFVAYYLGSREAGYEAKPPLARGLEGLYLGMLVTAGFVAIFATAGVVISLGLRAIVKYMPFAALAVGVGLLLLGLWLLAGKSLPRLASLPVSRFDIRARNPRSVILFGVAYAVASLSCTLPVFLAVVGASLATSGIWGSLAMFLSYAAGMAAVLTGVALGAALLKGGVAQRFRHLLPYMHRLSAALLVLAGLYLIWRQVLYLPLVLKGLGRG